MRDEPPEEQDRYPLSAVQYAMLLHSIVAPADGVYIQQKILTMHENLDVPSFKRALLSLAARHPVLRTCFELDVPGGPMQVVRSRARIDLAGADGRDRPDRLPAFLLADQRTPFEFSQGPPMRFALFRTDERTYVFVWTSHHALMDGRSYVILLTELFALYQADIAGEEIELPPHRAFAGYIRWTAGQDLTKAKEFWRNRLAGIAAPTPVGGGDGRPVAAAEEVFAMKTAALPQSLTSAIATAAAQYDVTVNSFIQGVWALFLARTSGCSDVLFGTAKSCRGSIEGGRDMVGLCINTIPFRVLVDSALTVIEFTRQLREQQIAVRGFEHTPLPLIRESCAIPRQEPFFESVVVFEDFLINSRLRALGGEWANREFRLNERSNYPLTLSAYLDASLTLKLAYDRRRFSDGEPEQILDYLRASLEAMATQPQARLGALLRRAHPANRTEWNNTAATYPRDCCAHQLFMEQARARPHAAAVIFEGRTLTYGELDRRSSQLAAFLSDKGIGPGALAGIYLERSAEMVVALLAIMKSGAAYVPMEPAYPPERIAYMLADTGLPLLVTHSSLRPKLRGCQAALVALDEVWDEIEEAHARDGFDLATAEGLAYVIYTSGSTGRPKGVKVGHRALTNLLSSMSRTPGFTANDRLLAVTTICFDIAGLELYLPLIAGGAVDLASAATASDGCALREHMERTRPSIMQATPATWKLLRAAGWTGDRNLKILCGGEALPRDLADELVPVAREVWNLYGPTETTIWSSVSRVEAGRRVTIGRPIANTQFYVLDERLQLVPPGVSGELYIAGDGVAQGYLGRPELTRERFLPCPFGAGGAMMYRTGDVVRWLDDGNMEYVHRLDRQVKLHGYRIEPGEIEYALRQHPSVREAVVLVREDAPGDRRLVAYLVAPQQPDGPSAAELRRHLKTTLPDYQIPAAFVPLDRMPLTPNGKIDCKALPKPPAERNGEGVPQGPGYQLERRIAAIWSGVLGQSGVALDDTFFEAGGNSLLLMEVVMRLQKEMQAPLTSVDMFVHPTVRSMAAYLAGRSEESRSRGPARRDAIDELRRKRLALKRRNAFTG